MKRLILLLALILLCGRPASAAEASLLIRGVTIAPGEEGQVSIEVTAEEPIGALELVLYYNRGPAQFVEGDDAAEPHAGEIRIVSLGTGFETHRVYTLTFYGASAGESVLQVISASLIDYENEEEQELSLVFSEAAVEVRNPSSNTDESEPETSSSAEETTTESAAQTQPEEFPEDEAEDPDVIPVLPETEESEPSAGTSETTAEEHASADSTEAASAETQVSTERPAADEETAELPAETTESAAEKPESRTETPGSSETQPPDEEPGFFGPFMIVLGLLIVSSALIYLLVSWWGKRNHPEGTD